MLRGFVVLVAVLLLSVAWAVSTARYTVHPGDTIYSLAKRFQTTPEVLLKLNNLSRPDLRVGQVLEVPQRTHTVVKGETLYGIARKYGVSLEALRGANGLSGDAVKLGQVLVIPWESAAASQQTPSKPAVSKPVSSPPATTGSSPGKPSPSSAAPPTTTRPPPAPPSGSSNNTTAPTKPTPSSPPPNTTPPSAPKPPSSSPASPVSSQPVTDALDPNALPPLPSGFPGMTAPTRPIPTLPTGANSARGIPPPPVPSASLPSFGEAITTPTVSSHADTPALIHTVQPGETLFGIARKYGVTVEDIKSLNQISSDAISAGQTLQIPVASVPTSVSPLDPVSSLRGVAERYLGVTYVYGGSSANGLDCSGFVSIVFRELGVTLPRTSREQFQIGETVDQSALLEGDLVFFNTTGQGVSHVGIYLGDDEFIHAASNPGKVIKSKLTEKYYAQRYLGARRVLRQD